MNAEDATGVHSVMVGGRMVVEGRRVVGIDVDRLIEDGVRRQDIIEIAGQSSYEGAASAALEVFKDRGRPLPDALFGINDIMAMGAMDALRHRLGIRIPDDLMVGGFDDIPEGRRLPYQLTTVRQPINAMVDETLNLLHLDEPDRPIDRGIDRPISGRLIWRNTIPLPKHLRAGPIEGHPG